MTEMYAPAHRRLRGGTTIVALSAAALLAASCATGDGDDGEGGTAAGEASTVTTTASSDEGAGAEGTTFATADLADPEGESRGTVRFSEIDGGTLLGDSARPEPVDQHPRAVVVRPLLAHPLHPHRHRPAWCRVGVPGAMAA